MTTTLTGAQFKAQRERMGLSTAWLARRWGVTLLTVQRWENTTISEATARRFLQLVDRYNTQVQTLAGAGAPTISVPRTDDQVTDGYPSAWHRSIAFTAAATTGAELVYLQEGP